MQINMHITGVILSNDTQITGILNFRPYFRKTISRNFDQIHDENANLCRLVQQELNVSYETSIFRSMFMLYKY